MEYHTGRSEEYINCLLSRFDGDVVELHTISRPTSIRTRCGKRVESGKDLPSIVICPCTFRVHSLYYCSAGTDMSSRILSSTNPQSVNSLINPTRCIYTSSRRSRLYISLPHPLLFPYKILLQSQKPLQTSLNPRSSPNPTELFPTSLVAVPKQVATSRQQQLSDIMLSVPRAAFHSLLSHLVFWFKPNSFNWVVRF
jgi:hypothetical protein